MLPCLFHFFGHKSMLVNNETIWIKSYLEESNIFMSLQKEKKIPFRALKTIIMIKKNPFGIVKSGKKNVLHLELKKQNEIISPHWESFVLICIF